MPQMTRLKAGWQKLYDQKKAIEGGSAQPAKRFAVSLSGHQVNMVEGP